MLCSTMQPLIIIPAEDIWFEKMFTIYWVKKTHNEHSIIKIICLEKSDICISLNPFPQNRDNKNTYYIEFCEE